ncbi:MAG: hypothetical protein N3A02_01165, partial [Rectinema sp.]|nr:hypothetical protein [Rectinema sp.]
MADVFLRGGIVMWPILLCSIVSLAFIIERLISLRVSVNFPPRLRDRLQALIREGNLAEALELCRHHNSPFAKLMHACLLRAGGQGFEMEAALEETGGRVLYDLRRNARPLGIV